MASVLQEPEIQFAQRLASNERSVRTKALKKLKKYLNVRSQNPKGGFTIDEFLKLWKGLFYCLWMQDKSLLQEELATQISGLIHSLRNIDTQFLFLESFLHTINREWNGIDRLRLDKFYTLVRFVFRQTFEMLKRKEWDAGLVGRFTELLSAQVLHTACEAPRGVRYHVLDIYLPELTRAGAAELTAEQNMTFIEPFCKAAVKTKDHDLLQAIYSGVFHEIVDQAPFAIEDLMREVRMAGGSGSDSDQDRETESTAVPNRPRNAKEKPVNGVTVAEEEEEEEPEEEEEAGPSYLEEDAPQDVEGIGPVLQFDYKALGDKLFELAGRSNTLAFNRKKLNGVVRTFRDLSEGVFPRDEYPEEVSTDEDDDMFGSRRRLRRKRRNREDEPDEEQGSVAKKRKGKQDGKKPANPAQSDAAAPAKKKKKRKRKKKKKEEGEKTGTEGEKTGTEGKKAEGKKAEGEKMEVEKAEGEKVEVENGPAEEEEQGGEEPPAAQLDTGVDQTPPATAEPPDSEERAESSPVGGGEQSPSQAETLDRPLVGTDTPAPLPAESQSESVSADGATSGEKAKRKRRRRRRSSTREEGAQEAHVEGAEPSAAAAAAAVAGGGEGGGEEEESQSAPVEEEAVPGDADATPASPGPDRKRVRNRNRKRKNRATPEPTQEEAGAPTGPDVESADAEPGDDSPAAQLRKRKKAKTTAAQDGEGIEGEAAQINGHAEEEAGGKKAKQSSEPDTVSTPTGPKKTLKKKKAKADSVTASEFITFQSPSVPVPLFCRKAKGSPSTPKSRRQSILTPLSESKKVTFGLKNNQTAEFKKTDRSLMVSPDGSSRVPFDPRQKPRFGVLKSPASPAAAKGKSKKNSAPKGRPKAADFF